MKRKAALWVGVIAILLLIPLGLFLFSPIATETIPGARIVAQSEGDHTASTLYVFDGNLESAIGQTRKALLASSDWEERDFRIVDGTRFKTQPYWVLKSDPSKQFTIYSNATLTVGGRTFAGVIGMKLEPSNTPSFIANLRARLRPPIHLAIK